MTALAEVMRSVDDDNKYDPIVSCQMVQFHLVRCVFAPSQLPLTLLFKTTLDEMSSYLRE